MVQLSDRKKESGFSLAEILVAVAVFAIIFIAALMIYDRGNRVFRSGVQSSNMQQTTRVAFDRVVADLRMAGFDYDRDGVPGEAIGGVNQSQQPDEQIEYIGQGAVTLRGNLDYEIDPNPTIPVGVPNCNQGCEPDYVPAQLQFPLVTTGNDEIVTYVLMSPTAPAGNPVRFFVDSFKPRKVYTVTAGTPEKEQEIIIESTTNAAGQTLYVDQTRQFPPYTLYRVTLKEDAATQANPNKVVFTPVADNIRSMQLQYYEDSAGTVPLRDLASPPAVITPANLAATVGGLGQYDPANPAASVTPRAIRRKVQSVRVTLIGMNEAPDFSYTDPTETIAAMRPYRKYRLETLVTPRNYSRRGMREQEFKEPGQPTLQRVCYGYCSVYYLEWTAPPPDATKGMVESYAIVYDTDNDTAWSYLNDVGNVTSAFVTVPDPEQLWFFAVKAVNSYGSATSTPIPAGPAPPTLGLPAQNATKPQLDTTQLHASGDGHPQHPPQSNQVMLQWQMPTAAASGTISCTSGSPSPVYPVRETRGFRVYRRVNTPAPNEQDNMPPGNGWTEILNENAVGVGAPTYNPLTNTVTWYDTTAANCVAYWYRVQAAERCPNPAANVGNDPSLNLSDISPPFEGQALSAGMPKAPAGLSLDYSGIPPNSGCDEFANTCKATLIWPRVQVDVNDAPMTIEYYRIYRKRIKGASSNTDEFRVGSTNYTESGGVITYTLLDGALDKNGVARAFPEHDTADNNDYSYEFTVAAESCDNVGAESTMARLPCPFGGGVVTTTLTNVIQGNGTQASPWMISTPSTLTVNTTLPVGYMRATLFPPVGAPVMICERTGSFTSTSCPWPTGLSDEVVYRVDVFFQDLSSPICTTTKSYFVSESNNNCCLTPQSFDPTIVSLDGPSGRVRVRLDNNCGDALTIQNEGVVITWNATLVSGGGGNRRLRRVTYPVPAGVGTTSDTGSADGVNQNCGRTNTACTATSDPADATTNGLGKNPVPGNSNSYILEFRFGDADETTRFTTNPLTKLCIQYRRPADLSTQTCKIIPVPSNTANVCD